MFKRHFFKTRGSSIFLLPLFCPSVGGVNDIQSYLISMLLSDVLLFRERLISPLYSLSYKIYTLWFSGRNWQAIQKLYMLKEFPLIRMDIYSNKGPSSKFQQSYQVREQLPEEGRRVRCSKLWDYSIKDQDTSSNLKHMIMLICHLQNSNLNLLNHVPNYKSHKLVKECHASFIWM